MHETVIVQGGVRSALPLCLGLILSLLAATSPVSSDEFTINAQTIQDRKSVFATVESVDRIAARARIGGTIANLTVDEGSEVTDGQQIAVISDRKLSLKLASVDATMESLTAQQKLAQTDLARALSLRKTGAVSQARLDETQTRLDIVKSEIASLKAEKSIVFQEMADGNVLAPVAGRVLSVPVTNGSVILAGETIAVIASNNFVLRLRLPERHAKFMKVGDRVFVGERGIDEYSDKLADGVVQQVYPELQNGQVIADVKVANIGDYFVGERTRVHVATGFRSVIAAPARYFHQRYGVTFARLKNAGEVSVRLGRPVTGSPDGEIEVLSGLIDGDTLVSP